MSTVTDGRRSEEVALHYLAKKGFKYITKNYFVPGGEIDLIMKSKDFVVFIEVKSLKANSDFYIYETLNKKKKLRLRRAINTWLFRNNMLNKPWRLDFVGIISFENSYKVEHFEFVEI